MQLNFNYYQPKIFSFKEELLSSFTPQQKKILAVATVILSCLSAIWFFYKCCFKATVDTKENLDDAPDQALKINGREFAYDESVTASDLRKIQKEIRDMNEFLRGHVSSLLSIQSKKSPFSIYDIEDALRNVKELENSQGIEITFDIENNTIVMSIPGWDFRAQAVTQIGTMAFPGKLIHPNSSSDWSFNTSNTSYKRMVELMQKLSLLSDDDQKKLIETQKDKKLSVLEMIWAIESSALSPESSSKELQRLVQEEEAEAKKINQGVEALQKRIAGKVKLSDLNGYTNANYRFSVYDWDRNRGGSDGAGSYLVGKVSFDPNLDAKSDAIDGRSFCQNLNGLNIQQIGALFHRILQSFNRTIIDGKTFTATSIHLRLGEENTIPNEPFLFVLGNPV